MHSWAKVPSEATIAAFLEQHPHYGRRQAINTLRDRAVLQEQHRRGERQNTPRWAV